MGSASICILHLGRLVGGGFLGTWPMVSLMILYLLMVISDEGGGQQRRCAVGRTTCYHAMFCSLSGISAIRRGAKKAFRSYFFSTKGDR